MSSTEEYLTDADDEHAGTITRVTYQFEAPVDGQPQQFQREGELSGRFLKASEHINVVYDPADPNHSRMTREFRGPRNALVATAVFLALGGALLRLARRQGKSSSPLAAPDGMA